jgi:isopenicillin N synthase-like dioxygenase
MNSTNDVLLAQNPDSTEAIPTLDISAYLAGVPGARERNGEELREISETVGFFYLTGHGVPQDVIDGVFAQSHRLHELPLEVRRRFPKRNAHTPHGYQAYEDQPVVAGKPAANLSSSYLFYMERGPNDPPVDPKDPLRLPNAWPDCLPNFREPVLKYYRSIEKLALAMLPIWAAALNLPERYFDPFFRNPWLSMSLTYYPPRDVDKTRPFGIKPHTDNTIMTILAQGDVPGLSVRMPSGHWRVADVVPGAFMVNTGNSLSRWTNGRFLSTKHNVVNSTGRERYSVPVFFGADLDAMLECLPTCRDADNTAKFPPITYRELQNWYFFGEGLAERSLGPGTKSDGKWMPEAAASAM